MEVCLKSSWFLLLLGFALFAATLQEPGNCPTSDQVSCTTGDKCNVNEDCDKHMICCSNPCYTKRCIPITKGVQGEKESEGPSESECRPYIEKALKELETGEAVDVGKESSENEESTEDIPTVEITDDSSHQEQDADGEGDEHDADDGGNESDETTETEIPVEAEDEEEVAQESSKEAAADGEESDEVADGAKSEEDEDKDDDTQQEDESAETQTEQSEEDQEETIADEQAAEDVSEEHETESDEEQKEDTEAQQASAEKSEEETPEENKDEEKSNEDIVEAAESVEELFNKETIELQGDAKSKESQEDETVQGEAEQSVEKDDDDDDTEGEDIAQSEESKGEESKKEDEGDDEESDEEQEAILKETTSGESKEKASAEGSKEDVDEQEDDDTVEESAEDDKPKVTIDEGEDDKSEESEEHTAHVEKTIAADEKSEEVTGKCPPADSLSCQAGKGCDEGSDCGDDEMCCPNKCYRKQCVSPAEASDEDDTEAKSDLQEPDDDSEESIEGGLKCPSSHKIACGSGEKCGRNRECSNGEICCTNKCYRKQCVPPASESEEEEESAAKPTIEETEDESEEVDEGLTCPSSDKIPCGSGEKCGRNRDCTNGEICCTNKCYRKQCATPVQASSEEKRKETRAVESAEEEESTESEEGLEDKCPPSSQIACGSGEKCGRHRDCDKGDICCPNKCYRKQCVSPLDESDEVVTARASAKETLKDKKVEPEPVSLESEEDDCPSPEEVPCNAGKKCGGRRDCDDNEICCPNKCYRKECVSADGSDEKPVKKAPAAIEKKREVKVKVVEEKIQPVPTRVEKVPPKKVVREVKRKEESKEDEDASLETEGEAAVEDLSFDTDIPSNLRSREHVEHLLKLDRESSDTGEIINKVSEITLKELKKLYENAIKPLETLYKYRDLSNRHFGDAEIFSKPLVLFMGPWSGGKSSIINYLVNNEYNETSLRTGAEPSPAYFNILMYGDEPEVIDGTELAADFTFSGLQKFGQGLEERLRGVKLPSRLLEKVNIVEIPGILEVRKQVSRVFPFNDACQWFIDRADIIFLVYDPSKLDVGPETEAILDQLKGREHQTRIVLNKADQVKPEELMRVQGALIWNISPLMSSPQPPVMYTTSLWSRPYEAWAPTRLLQAQERAFLRDLRTAVDKRIENKIASARRFAVRVRNHAKMVDCYLTTYYNHKSVFGNRKQVANEIIDHPQDYHIYEGLSTLTNISRYDLPDPDVYRDFFKLNPLYDFQQLSATCTYFRGCPINRLDIAIAYDLPELVGTHKKNLEESIASGSAPQAPTTPGS